MSAFLDVYNRINVLDFDGTRMLFIHGALGVGKSCILAAMACLFETETPGRFHTGHWGDVPISISTHAFGFAPRFC